jgi:hypothetical protein
MDTVEELHEGIFREHPFPITRSNVVDQILENPTIQNFFDVA